MEKTWICTVCGYTHHGDSPPDVCPVCGATSDLFEEQVPQTAAAAPVTTAWRCLNCEYIHPGSEPPAFCPVCGEPPERFEPHTQQTSTDTQSGDDRRVVIIGAGIAGIAAAEAIRKQSAAARITVVSRETYLPYYRLNLTRYLAGEIEADSLDLHPAEWYADNRIELIRDNELRTTDTTAGTLTLQDGKELQYDKLILTTGSHPFVPPFPGANRENVTPLRTRDDADRIIAAAATKPKTVVIGGGVLGLEAAGALAQRGLSVTLLEGHGWLLPRQLNPVAGELLEKHTAGLGITLMKGARTKEIVGDERARGILLTDGTVVDADLVIIATGVRANSYLARMAGLEVNNGIIVNDRLQSSHPDIYAAGDVAEHRGALYGTWGPSQFQGAIAGLNAAGAAGEFAGIPRSNGLKVLGVDLFSIGRIPAEDASYLTVDGMDGEKYYYFNFHDTHLVGAILLGDTSLSASVKTCIEDRKDCSALVNGTPDVSAVLNFLMEKEKG